MPAATLAFSITAHERVDVLRGQVLNILHFCAAPVIILHVSAAFRATLDADSAALSIFRRLATLPGVVVNPSHLPTKWAHMFHAHLANIRHLERTRATYSHLVLSSSADLFFRPGVETHVAAFDAGLDNFGGSPRDSHSGDFWGPRLEKDGVFWGMLAACGSDLSHKSLHEGTFYRRDLLLRALAVIDAHVTDWDYDDHYPKEEYFLPSLVRAIAPQARIAPRLAHALALGHTVSADRLAVQHALRALGAGGTPPAPLANWLADADLNAQAPPRDLQSRFMLARLVRSTTDPLRSLMNRLPETLPASERAELCDRLDCFDLLALDVPGKSANTEPPVLSAVASRAFDALAADPLLGGLDTMRTPTTREIDPCPATFLPPAAVWPAVEAGGEVGRLQSCATRVAEGGVSLTLAVADGALTMAVEAPAGAATPQPGQRPPEVFVFWPAPALDPQRHRALRLHISGDAPLLACISLWIEYHTPGGKRNLGVPSPILAGLPEREGERYYWLLNRAALLKAMDEIGPGRFQIYLAVRPVSGRIAIREAVALH